MKTVTLQIDDSVEEEFFQLLERFSKNEVSITSHLNQTTDDEYLRSIPGMVESIKKARCEPNEKGVGLDRLDWLDW
uniref:Uncharacterized protein n=1 Tax=Candidatus Kentrum sp. LFY TaxID=2126342 RepID=A0A450WRP0_9GAMM|nr:MAG: hypothetical protein BECKLFY1418C_GA0070996_10628 [Candidatus Kentron sp. LFY]